MPEPDRPGRTLLLPLGVLERDREDNEMETMADELRRERGGISAASGDEASALGLARGEWVWGMSKWTGGRCALAVAAVFGDMPADAWRAPTAGKSAGEVWDGGLNPYTGTVAWPGIGIRGAFAAWSSSSKRWWAAMLGRAGERSGSLRFGDMATGVVSCPLMAWATAPLATVLYVAARESCEGLVVRAGDLNSGEESCRDQDSDVLLWTILSLRRVRACVPRRCDGVLVRLSPGAWPREWWCDWEVGMR